MEDVIDIQAEKEEIVKIYDESIHKNNNKENIGGKKINSIVICVNAFAIFFLYVYGVY